MSNVSSHASRLSRAGSSAPSFDTFLVVALLPILYASIVGPLLYLLYATERPTLTNLMETRWENRIFFTAVAAITLVLAIRNHQRLRRRWPPHIIALCAYLAFAGASILWAFNPPLSFNRFAQQTMLIASIIIPAMLAARTVDMMRGLFLCFALGVIVNLIFVLNNSTELIKLVSGYPGYFTGKNYLGQFVGVAFLLSLHEVFYPGFRRSLGIVLGTLAVVLLVFANSKTALGLAFVVPCLAGVVLMATRLMRVSPAIQLLFISACYVALSNLTGFNMNRLSMLLYGDPTFTGRTAIWDFANFEIARRPLLGWGYQSFWLAGPNAPSITDAPGWIKTMPNAHSGYLDTMLEMGYVGLSFLLIFIVATLHAIGRVAARAPARAWLLLSLALFVLLYNFLESLWMRGFEFLWVVFLVVAAEAARYWQPSTAAAYGSKPQRPGSSGPSQAH